MNARWIGLVFVLAAVSADASQAEEPAVKLAPSVETWIGGVGGAYLLAEPGPLVVEVGKRDRNRPGLRTELRAILAGPDRKVLAEAVIPDDRLPPGKVGPPQYVLLKTNVPRKGVYALNITVSQDRYGEHILWSMRTNCRHYLLETSRGHRDARHEEPIVLENPDRPGDVCFLPRRQAIALELSGVPKTAEKPAVYAAHGKRLAELDVDGQGRAACTLAADVLRNGVPWRLHLPVAKAIVQVDGLTRWDKDESNANLSLWTPEAASFFPLHGARWLVTPYRQTQFGSPGTKAHAKFRVHNNADQPRTIDLCLEFSGQPWPVNLATDHVALKAGQECEIPLCFTVPEEGQTHECYLRATPRETPAFSTYATLTVKGGTAPAAKPLVMPLVLKPYDHENSQLGYLPDYPTESQPYFDFQNRPFFRTFEGVATSDQGHWISRPVRLMADNGQDPSKRRLARAMGTMIAFDRTGHLYLPGLAGGQAVLLDSADSGQSYSAWPLPGLKRSGQTLEIEGFTGQNTADGPPPMLRYTLTAQDPKRIWRTTHDLELLLPRRIKGRVTFAEPVLVSRKCIGLSNHSGMPASIVSRNGRTHVVWGETTDPELKIPGVPTFVATYDRDGRCLGEPVLVAYGPPANDIHNSPSITIDSKGYVHMLAGTHGQPFPYARSLQKDTTHGGWTKPVPVAREAGLTYIGMMCGSDDTLHLVCRYWRRGEEPFPASHHATLAYLRKPPGGDWQPPRVLVVPPFSEYSVFYHRLTIDQRGRLFLSYDCWSTYWFYRNDQHQRPRSLLFSPDGGSTWKLAETRDLLP